MLKIKIPGMELWDEKLEEFKNSPEMELKLEHSLLSISKWEAKYHKPFFSNSNEKTNQEAIDYIRFMVLDENIDLESLYFNNDVINKINDYINDSQTATWLKKNNNSRRSGEQVTSELVYYWMIALNIPFECQYWHFNRLLTLIEVCNIKNEKPKNLSKKELYSRNSALNALRKKQMGTRG